MAILKKYKNFKDLKSSKTIRIENTLDSKELVKEFQNFISSLQKATDSRQKSDNLITLNEKQTRESSPANL